MSHWLTRSNGILAGIVVLAACLRFFRLDTLPPGLEFDQAFNAFDLVRLLQGQFAIFFPANTGREPLYFYLLLVAAALFGSSALALKVTSAIIGLATIPLIYVCVRALFRSNRIATLTALFTTVSFWHIFFSRYGLRVILQVPLTLLIFFFLWRAIAGARTTRRAWILVGVFTALALYNYPTGRLMPLAIIFLVVCAAFEMRARAGELTRGALLAFAVAAILFLPLGLYFVQHPEHFASHTYEVSIFYPHAQIGDNALAEFFKNGLKVAGMFFVAGDEGALRNLPGRPIFDPGLGALFGVGVLVWLAALIAPRADALNRRRALFLLVWLGAILGSSLFSDDAPNFLRTLPALPAVMILPAWGASVIWDRVRAPAMRRVAGVALSGVIVASGVLATYDYFVVLANDPGTYYAFDVDKVELSEWINQTAPTTHIYLAPLLQQNGTISFLTRNAPVKSFESRDTVVLPSQASGKDAVYVFPFEQEKKLQTLAARLGSLGARETIRGASGVQLAALYRVPAQNLPAPDDPFAALKRGGEFLQPQQMPRAMWSDPLELIGYAIQATDASQRNLEVTLFFRALAPLTEAYTFSLKARDAQERTWGQEDKWTGNNSYATNAWSPDEIVIEKFYPGLNACAPAGAYRVTVEAYEPQTSRTLGLADGAAQIVLNATRADASPSNLLEHLEPDQTLNAKIGERLQLIGYTLTPDTARAGDAFSLSLFWRGVGAGSAEKISVRLKSAAQETVLGESEIKIPAEGRGICAFYDLRVPAQLPAGKAALTVNHSQFAEMTIAK